MDILSQDFRKQKALQITLHLMANNFAASINTTVLFV